MRDLLMGTTILVSRNATGTGSGNWYSTTPAISANGRYVAFASGASDLDPLDASFLQDIFLFDRVTETTRLVSVNHAGTAGGNHHSYNPSVAVDGMGHVWVAFESYSDDLVSGISDSNGTQDMFLRDVTAGMTRLVSVNSDGTDTGDRQSYDAQLSADGSRLVFQSYATNLVAADDLNDTTDIFVHDISTSANSLVSVNATGTASGSGGASGTPVLSTTGAFIAFYSDATDLSSLDGPYGDIFLRDVVAGTTVLVSVDESGTGVADGYSYEPAISADGRYVAFRSDASNLSPLDGNFSPDVYLYDGDAGSTELVSLNSTGTAAADNWSHLPTVAIDGSGDVLVGFASYANDLVAGIADGNGVGRDIYVRNMTSGTTELVTINSDGTSTGDGDSYRPQFSDDGARLTFQSVARDLLGLPDPNQGEDVFAYEPGTAALSIVSLKGPGLFAGNGSSDSPVLSSTGNHVGFRSDANTLTPVDSPYGDIFLRDVVAGTTVLVSVDEAGTGVADWYSYEPAISADGRYVAFRSDASNLSPLDGNFNCDVYVYDSDAGSTEVVSLNSTGTATADHCSHLPTVAVDGSGDVLVGFASYASDLVAGIADGNGVGRDIYVRNMTSATTELVTINSDGTSTGDGDSYRPQFSDDGARLTFQSVARDLLDLLDPNQGEDVFVYDPGAAALSIVSLKGPELFAGNGSSDTPVLSSTGNHIGFRSDANALTPADGPYGDIFLRDLVAGTTVLASVDEAGTGVADWHSYEPAISADGRYVAFRSDASNLSPLDSNSSPDVYLYDSDAGSTGLVSLNNTGTAATDDWSHLPTVAVDGSGEVLVGFASYASDVVAGIADGNGNGRDIYVRNMTSATTELVTINSDGTATGDGDSYAPQLSDRANTLTFESYASDLVSSLSDVNAVQDIFAVGQPLPPAIDIRLLEATADGGTGITVRYEIVGGDATAFELGFYQSPGDTFHGQALLATVVIDAPADLAAGIHAKSYTIGSLAGQIKLPGAGLPDPLEDYHLLVVADHTEAVLEDDIRPANEDNTQSLTGAYHLANGNVMVLSGPGPDMLTITTSGSDLELDLNGVPITYAAASVSGFRIRTHAGADVVNAGSVNKPVWVWGGADDDTLLTGSAADYLNGGHGDDTLRGGRLRDVYAFDTDLPQGSDTLDDIGGVDTLDFSAGQLGIVLDLAVVDPQALNANLTLTLSSDLAFEQVLGTSQADAISGNNTANRLEGRGGDDFLDGRWGHDQYFFDADAPLGTDQIADSAGKDTLYFNATRDLGVNVDLSNGFGPQVVNANLTLWLLDGQSIEHIFGTIHDDVLIGNSLANTITGLAGHDHMEGGDGRDQLDGGPGDDMLVGGAENDRYLFDADGQQGEDTIDESGGGIDTLDFSKTTTAAISIDLAMATRQTVSPNLTLDLGAGDVLDHVIGGSQDDTLSGNALHNALTGGPGNDTLTGGLGNDTYRFDADDPLGTDMVVEVAGGGLDGLYFDATTTLGITLDLNLGSQSLNANLNLNLSDPTAIENVRGTQQADAITGNAGPNRLAGLAGDDLLDGGEGNDMYEFDADGPLGSDTLFDAAGTDALNFRGTQLVSIAVDLAQAVPQAVNANLTLTLGADDRFEHVYGSAQADTLQGNALNNWLSGEGGADTLFGHDGHDSLTGGEGDDSLTGGDGNDEYRFGADTLLGADTIDESGGGVDALNFGPTQIAGVSVNLADAALQFVNGNLALTLGADNVIENLFGGHGNDSLSGNTLGNVLVGGAGDDTLAGGPGDDTYWFKAHTASGTDFLSENAGEGSDWVDFSETLDVGVTVDLNRTTVQAVSANLSLQFNLSNTFENVAGTLQGDVIQGNSLGNILLGLAGDDQLTGLGARDLLFGGAGADTLLGGTADDLLIGGSTLYDLDRTTLGLIATEWQSGNNYTTRTSNLRAALLVAGTTVLDDAMTDSLTGNANRDWFFGQSAEVSDQAADEDLDVT